MLKMSKKPLSFFLKEKIYILEMGCSKNNNSILKC
jgi:hypothetical protein